MSYDEMQKYVDMSEAQANAEEQQAKLLLASAADRRFSNGIIRQLMKENNELSKQSTTIVNGDLVENKTVQKQVIYIPQKNANLCQKKDQILSLKETM